MNTEWLPPSEPVPAAPFRTDEREPWGTRDEPWTHEPGPARTGGDELVDAATAWTPTGRLVNLRFLRSGLRRLRWLWMGAAIVGLAAGVGYHVAVPLKYTATATLYLAEPTAGTGTAPNDLAMLNTIEVSKRAIALLGEKDLSPTSLLGKQPGVMTSNSVLVLTISGPSPKEAVRRVDAVAQAYLSFRAERFAAQNRAVLAAERRQLRGLQHEVAVLTNELSALPSGTSTKATALENQRGIDTAQIVSLEGSIQQTAVNTLTLSKGSKVISPGTALTVSKKKVFGMDGLSGLLAGLGGGLLLASVAAVLSDRPRTREDVSSLLGVSVDLSLGEVGGRGLASRSLWELAGHPDPELTLMARHFGERLPRGVHAPGELVVAVDDIKATAAALLVLAGELSQSGRRPVLVDATDSRQLAKAFGIDGTGAWALDPETGFPLEVLVPPRPWEEEAPAVRDRLEALDRADAVLVLATVNPSVGAHHLRRWGSRAVVTLHAGTSSAQRIGAIGELLNAADVTISSVVLLGADCRDESSGQATARPTWDW
jgi:Chain length determinant protein